MRVSDFEIKNLENPLRNPHCIVTLDPWINVGNVGKNVVRRLSKMYSIAHVGELLNPSKFYDFTRYRPEIFIKAGIKSTKIPNTNVSLIKDFHDRDLVIIEILEPHALAEKFNDSRLEKLSKHILFHEKPELLDQKEKEKIAYNLAARVTSANKQPWRTIDDAIRELASGKVTGKLSHKEMDQYEDFYQKISSDCTKILEQNS